MSLWQVEVKTSENGGDVVEVEAEDRPEAKTIALAKHVELYGETPDYAIRAESVTAV